MVVIWVFNASVLVTDVSCRFLRDGRDTFSQVERKKKISRRFHLDVHVMSELFCGLIVWFIRSDLLLGSGFVFICTCEGVLFLFGNCVGLLNSWWNLKRFSLTNNDTKFSCKNIFSLIIEFIDAAPTFHCRPRRAITFHFQHLADTCF